MEIWDAYDINRQKTGKTLVRGEKIPEGLYHLVVESCVMNERGQLLIQRRAFDKDVFPGLWATTGGAALAGESSAQAVARENAEEMGFAPDFSRAKLLCQATRPTYHRDVWLFIQDVADDDIRLQKEEVADFRWVLPDDIERDETLRQDFEHYAFWQSVKHLLVLESMRLRIPVGRYRHFKGGEYQVEGLALDSETLEPRVLYRALYGTNELWTRPAAMWLETVTRDGKTMKRFERTE